MFKSIHFCRINYKMLVILVYNLLN